MTLSNLGVTFTHIAGLWGIAGVTAVFSLIYYPIRWRGGMSGFVVLCLIANGVGLAFSAWLTVAG